MKTAFRLLGFVLLASLLCHAAAAQELRIAAAADLKFAFEDVSAKFQTLGPCSQTNLWLFWKFLFAIKNGAPFDIFFSADLDYPARLDKDGLVEPGTFSRYTTGKIVLWVRKDSPINVAKGLQSLLDARVHKISIANPQHAPYGRRSSGRHETRTIVRPSAGQAGLRREHSSGCSIRGVRKRRCGDSGAFARVGASVECRGKVLRDSSFFPIHRSNRVLSS